MAGWVDDAKKECLDGVTMTMRGYNGLSTQLD